MRMKHRKSEGHLKKSYVEVEVRDKTLPTNKIVENHENILSSSSLPLSTPTSTLRRE